MKQLGVTAVLLSTFNGGRFLDLQLKSLAEQTISNLHVWASDDGSSDDTLTILTAWASRWDKGRFQIVRGPQRGFAENFRSLIVNNDIDADYYAYCDQDDVWDADKLEHAINAIAAERLDKPCLYCSRTRIIDEKGAVLGHSPLFRKRPSFRNAMVQSLAGGNTMVLNSAAHHLIAEASRRATFTVHDWWTYMIVSGAGGNIHYSPEPRVSYRQHGGNLIGQNDSWRSRLTRIRWLVEGRFAAWSGHNISGLNACIDLLDSEAVRTLKEFEAARSPHLRARIRHFFRSGVYRQTGLGQLGLYVACAVNRL